MNKDQVQEKIQRMEKELEELEKNRDELDGSIKNDIEYSHLEAAKDISLIEKEIEEKKLILKEYKERLRSL